MGTVPGEGFLDSQVAERIIKKKNMSKSVFHEYIKCVIDLILSCFFFDLTILLTSSIVIKNDAFHV